MRRGWAILSISLLSSSGACRDIVGFDEPAEAGAQVAPLLPFVPAKQLQEGCEVCAKENCTHLRDLCLEDEICAGLLTCNARCKDPVCFGRCGSFTKFGNASLPVAPENARDDDYQWCLASECRDSCGIGVNWECVGSETYRWPKDSSGPLPLQLSVVDELTLRGVPASVEARAAGNMFVERADTGAWGQVELDLNSQYTFSGYFLIALKLGRPGSMLYYPPTLFRPSRGAAGVVSPPSVPDAQESQLVSAAFSMRDCLGYLASGVSFEIASMSPGSTWSMTSEGQISGVNTTSEWGVVGLQGLTPKPGPVTVRAVRREKIVGSRTIELREGFFTRADLMPLSGDD